MGGPNNPETSPPPPMNRVPHSSAAFLHHLHTDPTSHHITLSASGSRLGPAAPNKSPRSISIPLEPTVNDQNKPLGTSQRFSKQPSPSPPFRDPVAGPSSLKGLGRVPSYRSRPKTAPTTQAEVDLPNHDSSPGIPCSPTSEERRSSEVLRMDKDPQWSDDEKSSDDDEPEHLVSSGDSCISAIAQAESGTSEANELMSMTAGASRSYLLGRAGSLRSPSAESEQSEHASPPVEQTSWKTFSKAYAYGMFDPNRIPIPPVLPSEPPSSRSSPGKYYSSMPAPRPVESDTATNSSGSRGAFSSTSGSSGTLSTQASSAPVTSAEASVPTVHRGKSSINLSLAARRKAYEVEHLPPPAEAAMRPDHLTLPSYSLAAATVRMASTNLRRSDLAPLHMPSPERELMDPMASVMSNNSASRMSTRSEPGSSRFPLSGSMSSALDHIPPSYLPTIQASPVGTPSEHPHRDKAPLSRRRTSPHRAKDGIVYNRIPPASAPIERTIEIETTNDYFGNASPQCERQTSYTSQSSSSRTTVQGTPMPLKLPRGSPISAEEIVPPAVAQPQEIGVLYEQFGWLPAPLPPNEIARRRALYRFNLLHTARDVNFDRIAHMAKLVFNSKNVLIALIDDETQWHKAQSGLGTDEVARISSLCSHSVLARWVEMMSSLTADRMSRSSYWMLYRIGDSPITHKSPGHRIFDSTPEHLYGQQMATTSAACASLTIKPERSFHLDPG